MQSTLGYHEDVREVLAGLTPFCELSADGVRGEFLQYSPAGLVVLRLSGWGTLTAAREFAVALEGLPRMVKWPRLLVDVISLSRVDPRADFTIGERLRALFPEVDRVAVGGVGPVSVLLDIAYTRVVRPGPIRHFVSLDSAVRWLIHP